MQRGRGEAREMGGRVAKLQYRAQSCISAPQFHWGEERGGRYGRESSGIKIYVYTCVLCAFL